jgi:hypothetical protein
MMMKSFFALLTMVLLFTSCKKYEKAPSGMLYIITHGPGNEKNMVHGEFVKFNVEYKLKSNDSILRSTYDTLPLYFPVDTLHLGKYTLTEIFLKCKKGDKIEFLVNIDSLVAMNKMRLNDVFKAKDIIIGRAEILEVFKNSNTVNADLMKEIEFQRYKKFKQ